MKSISKRILVSASLSLCVLGLVRKTDAGVPVSGNIMGTPAFQTIDFPSGTPWNSFTPDILTNVGEDIFVQDLAIQGDTNVLYSVNQITPDGIWQNVGIYLCQYGANGSGVAPYHNTGTFKGPRPNAVQALALHHGLLFALDGYLYCEPNVFEGLRIGNTIFWGDEGGFPNPIYTNYLAHGDPSAFTVLPNGDYLVNDYAWSSVFREYNRFTHQPTGLVIDLDALGGGHLFSGGSPAVCVGTSNGISSLYFNVDDYAVAHTDLAGNLIDYYTETTGEVFQWGISITNSDPSPPVTGAPPISGQPPLQFKPNYTTYTAASTASSTFVNTQRSQQVYGASQFPPGSVIITALRFRPAESPSGSAFSTTISNIQINLSTTTNAPDGLSTTFSNNVGADDTIVYSGSLNISSAYTGNDSGPRDGDIVVPLQTPFAYYPTNGNLLLDIRHFSSDSGNGAYISAFNESNDCGSRVVSSNPNSATADSADSQVDAVSFNYIWANDFYAPNYAAYNTTSSGSDTFVQKMRSQQVYRSSQFPAGPILITDLHFRPADAPLGGAFSTTVSNIQINLSTTTNLPDGLSTTFDDNIGADETVVYSGALAISSAFTGPNSGPRDSDIVVHLQTPFPYDPTNGNLLLDIRHYSDDSSNGAYTECFGETGDAGSRVVSTNPNSATASFSDSGIDVVDFIYRGAKNCVAPGYTAYTASSDASGTFMSAQRSQQVYKSSQFPSGPIVIRQLRFRPAETPYGSAFSTIISNIQINLSTTTNPPDGLSTTFANNVGSDNTVVYSGSLPISSAFTGNNTGGPRDMDIIINLQVPFTYDPSKGNLLLDIHHFSNDSGNGAYTECVGESDDGGSRVVSTNPSSATASFSDTGVDTVDFIYTDD